MSDHAVTTTDVELSIALAKARQRLVSAEAACDVARETYERLQAEQQFRRTSPSMVPCDKEHRDAVAIGEAPPAPIDAVTQPRSRAAAVRLASLPTILTRRNVPTSVVGQSRPVRVEERPSGPVVRGVSDHAVVRYLERVVGVDMVSIRSKIMTPVVESAIRSGVARIRTSEGVVVVREGIVTSFLPNDNGPNRRKGRYIDRGRTQRRPRHVVEADDDEWSGAPD